MKSYCWKAFPGKDKLQHSPSGTKVVVWQKTEMWENKEKQCGDLAARPPHLQSRQPAETFPHHQTVSSITCQEVFFLLLQDQPWLLIAWCLMDNKYWARDFLLTSASLRTQDWVPTFKLFVKAPAPDWTSPAYFSTLSYKTRASLHFFTRT